MNNIGNRNYDSLLGKSRYEVFVEYGEGSNWYSDDLWVYDLEKIFIIRETVLFIEFTNDYVSHVYVKTFYFGNY
ncbi:hypothetical protein CMU59_18345 [Elizabethkingia anophelis]|nr:hypothetical protein [Elizabethkingia anophelis]MDV3601335.1 hypothetical protein [Elizabethkingia anophelis]MDV3608600.1 hypothetical protein [Elizabethkingia anophelis]MDV3640604.1 hypothetical protein [Elizabethkingia anophelis]MDV3651318.1 hypothetical protein [Elizabethkingia anophelis]